MVEARDVRASHQDLIEQLPGFNNTYRAGVRRGVELGYLPASVEAHLDDALQKTGVRVADAFATAVHGDVLAYYEPADDEVLLRHDLRETDENFEMYLAHEFTHKLSGGTFVPPEIDGDAPSRPRAGFTTELRPDEYKLTGLNEGVNHHVTLGILHGDFETVDPDVRADGDDLYRGYRKTLDSFISQSKGMLDIKTIINAYFEDTDPTGGFVHRRKLVRETTAAYGRGALNKFEKLCDLAEMASAYDAIEIVLDRIHSPTIDDQGRVTEVGTIDIENMPTIHDFF